MCAGRGREDVGSCHRGKGSRTAHDGGGEGASDSNGASGSAPREGGCGTLKEHCPGENGGLGVEGEEVG